MSDSGAKEKMSPEDEAVARGERPISSKSTNPKDSVGVRKWRQFTCVPTAPLFEIGVAMLEGARKYGKFNWRVGKARASVYVDAALGHIYQWWEGEDDDPDSKVSHLTKAITSLMVMRDAMIQGRFVDDRPPKTNLPPVREQLQAAVDDIFERTPHPRPGFIEGDQYLVEGEPSREQLIHRILELEAHLVNSRDRGISG